MNSSHTHGSSRTARNGLLAIALATTVCVVLLVEDQDQEREPGVWGGEPSNLMSRAQVAPGGPRPRAIPSPVPQRTRFACEPLQTPNARRMSCW